MLVSPRSFNSVTGGAATGVKALGLDSALLLSYQLTIKLPYTFEPGSLGGVLANMTLADGPVGDDTLPRGRIICLRDKVRSCPEPRAAGES